MILQDVYQFLRGVSPSLCDAIYPEYLPLTHALPAITVELDSNDDEQLLDGSQSSLRQALVTVNCYDPSLLAAGALADRVKSALIGYRGSFGSVSAECIYKESETSAPETETGLRGISIQFFLGYS